MSLFWYFLSFVSVLVATYLLWTDPTGSVCCVGTGTLFFYMADRIDPFS